MATETMNTNQVTVTGTATLIVGANGSREELQIQQVTGVFIGGSANVTPSNGFPLTTGRDNFVTESTAPWWGITSGGSVTIAWSESTRTG